MEQPELFETWLTQLLHRPQPALMVLLGPPNIGKTARIQVWKERSLPASPRHLGQRIYTQHDDFLLPPTAFLCSAIHRETPTHCARRLLEELGNQPLGQSAHDLWQELGYTLKTNSISLLLFDQAERLSLDLCHCLQASLYERAQRSILLIGTSALRQTVQRDPSLERHILTWHTLDQFNPPPEQPSLNRE